ncbi:MAG: hypothetical protein OXF86_18765 [Caldilineaceae bacterium]|nr:hypothetical protein [Caldilineaceae bacterium]
MIVLVLIILDARQIVTLQITDADTREELSSLFHLTFASFWVGD